MRVVVSILWIAGLCLLLTLISLHGFGDVASAFSAAGWGIAIVAAFHSIPTLAAAWSWRLLIDEARRPPWTALLRIRWISESVNVLLPVAHVGGDVVRARLLARAGVPGAPAAASVIADVTLGLLTELLFALAGVVLLFTSAPEGGRRHGIVIALAAYTLLLVLFFLAQRRGMFRPLAGFIARFSGASKWRSITEGGAALDRSLTDLYRNRRAVALATAGRMAGWLLGTGEVWLGLRFLGHPVGLGESLMIESLSQALRSAVFLVPGALGVQEGGLMVLGGLVGLDPVTALALSLIKRARELCLGIPGLVVWQVEEGRRFWAKRRLASAGTEPEGSAGA